MSGEKKVSDCLHITIWRLPEEKKHEVIELGGYGSLNPVLQCNDCGSTLYLFDRTSKARRRTGG